MAGESGVFICAALRVVTRKLLAYGDAMPNPILSWDEVQEAFTAERLQLRDLCDELGGYKVSQPQSAQLCGELGNSQLSSRTQPQPTKHNTCHVDRSVTTTKLRDSSIHCSRLCLCFAVVLVVALIAIVVVLSNASINRQHSQMQAYD
jgi:hypothetical protein